MSKNSRRHKPSLQGNGSGPVSRCDRRIPRARTLLLCLLGVLVLAMVLGVYISSDTPNGTNLNRFPETDLTRDKVSNASRTKQSNNKVQHIVVVDMKTKLNNKYK